jgi:hypothetical protein
MKFPFPGMKVFIESDSQILEYLDTTGSIQTVKNVVNPVTNYEYEVKENERKRTILVLRPEYIGAVTYDMRNMMKYDRSSQYVDSSTKKTYNPRNNI